MLSGYNKDWKLVSENGEVEFYVNYLSHVIVRTLLGVTFCVIFRILLSKCLYVGEGFGYFSIITDIISYGVSQMFPASLILAMIVLLSYFVIGFRFIYDVIITGHGLNWLFYQTKNSFQDRKKELTKNMYEFLGQRTPYSPELASLTRFGQIYLRAGTRTSTQDTTEATPTPTPTMTNRLLQSHYFQSVLFSIILEEYLTLWSGSLLDILRDPAFIYCGSLYCERNFKE
ncbi:hypothetical protein TNCT_411621 [Trichonephila clavata]|uniref:Uncharacterized protein n=1 Tax=Trichonephila clavata TaxID=2740835 RepID=A0A8X6J5G8_TRICU|nr:hypothetical protein TNCT_411621 [Trichonephila clavata]